MLQHCENETQAQWKMLEAVTRQEVDAGVSKQLLDLFVSSADLSWLDACHDDHLITWQIFHGALAPHWLEGRRRKHSSDLSDLLQEDVARVPCPCSGSGCEKCEDQRVDWGRKAYCWSAGYLARMRAEAWTGQRSHSLEGVPFEIHAFREFFIYYVARVDSSKLHSVITGGIA